MITVKDSVEVEAAPEKVFEWVAQRLTDKEALELVAVAVNRPVGFTFHLARQEEFLDCLLSRHRH